MLGAGEAFICAGVESMTRVPMGGFNISPNPTLLQDFPQVYMSMGHTAEEVAKRYRVSRREQEAFAVESHAKAARARELGLLADEIVPITTPNGVVSEDGCIRPGTNLDALAQLKPAFDGTVTAGTASPLTDGAAALLVCTESFARERGLNILARIKAVAVAGCAPEIMGMGPLYATRKVLQRAGLSIDDIELVEINEAFASQSIACVRELNLDMARVNLDGGATALGHPLGATGARIAGKAASLLRRTGGRYAIATQCIAGGQGVATLLESVER
jgi:acetyl-CoA acyltransferase